MMFDRYYKLKSRLVLGSALFVASVSILLSLFLFLKSVRAEDVEVLKKDITSLEGDHKTDNITLLAGQSTIKDEKSLTKTINNYFETYLLGVAADFCVFLNDDFTVRDSDSEGRVAVGGDLKIDNEYHSYAIGAGDYEHQTSLEVLIPSSKDAAHIVLGGDVKDGQIADVYYDEQHNKYEGPSGNDIFGNPVKTPTEKTKKLDLNRDNTTDADLSKLESTNVGDWQKIGKDHVYVTELFDFNSIFERLKERSQELTENESSEGTLDGNVLTFNYDSDKNRADCVYFTVNWETFRDAKEIKFTNIPDYYAGPRKVMDNNGEEKDWPYAYIVVNVTGKGEQKGDVYELRISNKDLEEGNKTTYINERKIGYHDTIDEKYTKLNNHIGVESLLYNFPNANENTKIILGRNFQGTIFAPGADVTDGQTLGENGDHGHISGALIAKSFEGKTEFGYRTFTGGIELLTDDEELEDDGDDEDDEDDNDGGDEEDDGEDEGDGDDEGDEDDEDDEDDGGDEDGEDDEKSEPVQVEIEISASITGRDGDDEEFEFGIYDDDDNLLETVKSPSLSDGKSGNMRFGSLEFDTPGEYHFKIKQTKGSDENTNYDEEEFDITITVTEDEETGKLKATVSKSKEDLHFENTYSEDPNDDDNTGSGDEGDEDPDGPGGGDGPDDTDNPNDPDNPDESDDQNDPNDPDDPDDSDDSNNSGDAEEVDTPFTNDSVLTNLIVLVCATILLTAIATKKARK